MTNLEDVKVYAVLDGEGALCGFSLSPEPGSAERVHTEADETSGCLTLAGWGTLSEANAFAAGVTTEGGGRLGALVQEFDSTLSVVLLDTCSGDDQLERIDYRRWALGVGGAAGRSSASPEQPPDLS